jgi:hypothetical protein
MSSSLRRLPYRVQHHPPRRAPWLLGAGSTREEVDALAAHWQTVLTECGEGGELRIVETERGRTVRRILLVPFLED